MAIGKIRSLFSRWYHGDIAKLHYLEIQKINLREFNQNKQLKLSNYLTAINYGVINEHTHSQFDYLFELLKLILSILIYTFYYFIFFDYDNVIKYI